MSNPRPSLLASSSDAKYLFPYTHTHTHKMNETMEEANKGKQKIRFISILIR